ncbi:MAG TPA: sensor histidine kinase [Frankiaceae bacterium]|nr:sensor histidine kinase [Frankiaceae bacterium]
MATETSGGPVTDRLTERLADPWQARLDRLRRLVPLPMLAVSTAAALAVPSSTAPGWARFELGLPLALAAAVGWTIASVRLRGDASTRWRLPVFAAHTAIAGVLVWVNGLYGVFAYIGFLFAYGLGARWRTAGFAATALIVSAAMSGGYPSSDAGKALTYVVVAGVLLALVLTTSSITNRAVDQNQERGRMIDDLAEANRRLAASMAENAELHDRLVVQARQAGITEERRRLAGEIHDTLAQGLTGIIAQLEAAEHTRQRPSESARHIGQARTLARSSLTEARRSVRALRPEQLQDATLPAALSVLAETWSLQSGVAADVHTTGEQVSAGPDAEAAIFRAAQESLSNVAKHARASKVRLTLTYLDDVVLLDVVDDGIGFAVGLAPARNPHGFGLIGMRERLTRVGGTLTVESTPGSGTSVNAVVPVAGSTDGGRR